MMVEPVDLWQQAEVAGSVGGEVSRESEKWRARGAHRREAVANGSI